MGTHDTNRGSGEDHSLDISRSHFTAYLMKYLAIVLFHIYSYI